MLEKSKALKVNLAVTAVDQIEIDPRFDVLRNAVRDYQGVLKQADHLLFELHHPFRNWDVVIPELRSFALKNLATYQRSPSGVEAIKVLMETFLGVIHEASREAQKVQAADGLLAFVEKVVQSVETEKLVRLLPAVEDILRQLNTVDDTVCQALATSFHPLARIIKKVSSRLSGHGVHPGFWEAASRILMTVREVSYRYWLGLEDPLSWLERVKRQYALRIPKDELVAIRELLQPVSHNQLHRYLEEVQGFSGRTLDEKTAIEISNLPGYLDIVRNYKEIALALGKMSCRSPAAVPEGTEATEDEVGLHLLFLFHLVEMEGLTKIHEEVLRQINRNLVCLIRTADLEQLQEVLGRSFVLLKQQVGHFPRTALQCIETLGLEVFSRNNTRLIELFLDLVVDFGFQTPGVRGVDTEWHILCNPAHLQNIRVWLNLVCQKPKVCSTLLSALIINLKLAGTCIKDTDLFQRDISRLLNCDIGPIYNLVKQFTKVLPVYYNEIGAEGLLRDVSTELDEISHRRDILIHFLRKQSHVESNNLIVDFIEAILCFWYSKQKEGLKPFLAPEILEQIPIQGPYIDHVHKLVRHLARVLELEPFARHLDRLLNMPEEELSQILTQVNDVPPYERRRLELLIKMYSLETMKYKLGTQEIRHHLEEAKKLGFEGLERVLAAIETDKPEHCLDVILTELEKLKGIILSSETFEVKEDIYHKRHIAADIPSMYGHYHEKKFDALGLTFRLENLANVYFERLIAETEVPFITRATFVNILKGLKLFWRAIQLNGVYSKKFSTYLTLLEKSLGVRRFSFSQYLDIVKGLSEGVKDMIYVYYLSPHQDNLAKIIRQLGPDQLLPKYVSGNRGQRLDTHLFHQVTERFLRELISSTFGLQHLDNFIGRVYQVLREQKELLNPEEVDLLLSYDPRQDLCSIHRPKKRTRNMIQLGNKGFNLVLLAEEGLPVPPGIIITTEVFRYYFLFQKLPSAYRDFRRQLRLGLKEIETRTGRRFGNPSNPLLLSVRSGAAISMPGMMSTIINVGSNLETIKGLAMKTGNEWFAWDNYRRFIQSWAMSFGLNRDVFTELMRSHKRRYGVKQKREFTGAQMRELALAYRDTVIEKGIALEEDPFEQLLVSIRLVIGSWNSEKAKAYREIMEISDNWGTAVIVQSMSYGNLSESSGTGVVFTANPYRKLDRVCLWGDYTSGNQGEDIVSGLVSTHPISIEQKEALGLDTDLSMEEQFPRIYNALLSYTKHLIYEKRWTPQEIEFTFEGPEEDKLFILQSRDMTTKKRGTINVFVPSSELEASYLSRGIGVSGGALSGKAVFTLDEIERMRRNEPNERLILIRSDTVPDDIREISAADGLLTAKGGQTSHAAIVAFRLDKTCVVGCDQMRVYENRNMAKIQGHVIRPGDFLSIDGRNGSVYKGRHPTKIEENTSLI